MFFAKHVAYSKIQSLRQCISKPRASLQGHCGCNHEVQRVHPPPIWQYLVLDMPLISTIQQKHFICFSVNKGNTKHILKLKHVLQ